MFSHFAPHPKSKLNTIAQIRKSKKRKRKLAKASVDHMRIYRSARATTKCKIEFQLTRKLIELISENKILIFSYLFSPSEAEETHG